MDYTVETRQQLWGDFEQKWAEATGTALMPSQGPGATAPTASKSVIPKTGSAETAGKIIDPSNSLFAKHRQMLGIVPTPVAAKTGSVSAPEGVNMDGVSGEQPSKNPQAATVNSRVSVDGKEPPKVIHEKTAQHYALPSNQRYPLDSYSDVEKAAEYFDEWQVRMSPGHKHEYCTNLVKRASVLGVKVGDMIQRYGSDTYAPAQQIKIALDGRRTLLQDEAQISLLDKLAECYVTVNPAVFAEALGEFDKLAGIDGYYDSDIPDPFYSVFGLTKTATMEEDNESFIVGNEYVNNEQLKLLGRTDMTGVKEYFGEEFVAEYRKDPPGIFNSLPVEQKKIIARMANDLETGY